MCGHVLTFPSFYSLPCSVLWWLCWFRILGLCLDLWACDFSLLALTNLSLYLDWGPCRPGWVNAWNSTGYLVFCLLFLRANVSFGKCRLKRWFAHWAQKGFSAPSHAQEIFLDYCRKSWLHILLFMQFLYWHSVLFYRLHICLLQAYQPSPGTGRLWLSLPGSPVVCWQAWSEPANGWRDQCQRKSW